ncbi:Laminin G 2 and Cadherin and EGF CA domain contai ning protein [Trichuris trichiura]|uniref:Laminin G 2 and Cadherin and EGF CA domain contai ning protein n=1 Tax=Trichuris trichiura TaxID=36087 RepID=A0A077Z8Y8_TRITR|nr:Laminin G 2 and Cadherin and EGF CA domain contai ning protein [Trichuris trichiura]
MVGRIRKLDGYEYRLSESNPYFDFDPTAGEIRTRMELDRELLPEGSNDEIELIILGSSPTYFITAKIRVLDINDNAPAFPFAYQNVSLPESAKVGTKLVLIGASDPDAGANGSIVGYNVTSGDVECCEIPSHPVATASGSSVLLLQLREHLDRERKDLYILNVSATDGGSPPLVGYTTVFLNVLDANDNAPVFEKSHYSMEASEILPAGSKLIQVKATDADLDENARVTYRIYNDHERQFSIDEMDGWISTTRKLSCPERTCHDVGNCSHRCTFTVEAVDHGQPPQRGRAFVDVLLLDENDHPPEISFRFRPAGSSYAIIDDQKPLGSVVALVSIADLDQADNGRTETEIVDGNELGNFRLDSSSGYSVLRVNGSLDSHPQQWYNLTIRVRDLGSNSKSTEKTLRVFVKKIRSQPPAFSRRLYRASLAEDAPVGSYVADVLATLSDGQSVAYSILSGDEPTRWFRIDEHTGLITTIRPLDFEVKRKLTLLVGAKGGREPGMEQSTVAVEVDILDVNDNAPKFLADSLKVKVSESVPSGSCVGHIRATDADEGPNGSVRYYLCDESVNQGFLVSPATGALFLTKAIDREEREMWILCVEARDQGEPSLKTNANLHIQVLDVNDNAPKFYPHFYASNLLRLDRPGKLTAAVKAIDPDKGLNGTVSYFFFEAPQGAFDLNSTTGQIFLRRWPAGTSELTLLVGCKDEAGKVSSNNATVVVRMMDSMEVSPRFTRDHYEFRVAEDYGKQFSAGRSVGSISAVDFDSTFQVQYRIVDGDPDGVFEIGPYSGEIRSRKRLDFETASAYRVAVLATGKQAAADALVDIYVEDLNDNHPVFKHSISTAFIDDRYPAGYPLLYGSASDADSQSNAAITYRLESSLNDDFIGVHATSGLVSLKRAGSFVLPGEYNFTLWATDSGIPPLSSSTLLSLRVYHQEDEPKMVRIHLDIPEDTPVNKVVRSLPGGNFTALQGSIDNELFGVFPDGGVYVKRKLDYEMQNFQKLSVRSGRTLIDLDISITDVNDNAPTFVKGTFRFSIEENQAPLTYVGTVLAQDADAELNGAVRYRIIHPDDRRLFSVNPITGDLVSLAPLDREELQRVTRNAVVSFGVEAYDLGHPKALKSQCRVVVEVTDQNDHAPQFTLDMYTAIMLESKELGSEVLRISARDEDAGVNGLVKFYMDAGDLDGHFELDEASGQLTLLKELDREDRALYRLRFRATDCGTPPLSSYAWATIVILDVNDNPPRFTSNFSLVEVAEDTALGSCVFQANAKDPDAMNFGTISYSFPAGLISGPFQLDRRSGCLTLIKPLDFEKVRNYSVVIIASDGGSPSLSSSTEVHIQVVDVNDNAPIFKTRSLVGQMDPDVQAGTEVLTVVASDADSGLNGLLRFSILHQHPDGIFKIEPASGVVSTRLQLDNAWTDTYKLLVEVEDQAEPSWLRKSTRRLATIAIREPADSLDTLNDVQSLILPSMPRAGQLVGRVRKDHAATLEMAPNSTHLPFAVTSQGAVYLKSHIRRAEAVYTLWLQATDRQNRSFDIRVHLLWNGRRSEEFQFEKGAYSFSLSRLAPVGTEIGYISVRRSPSARGVQYFIVNADRQLAIGLDKDSGRLTVVKRAKGDGQANFLITVVAVSPEALDAGQSPMAECTWTTLRRIRSVTIDGNWINIPNVGQGRLRATESPLDQGEWVNISISARNEAVLQLSEDFYRLQVAESAPAGSVVATVGCAKRECGDELRYSLIDCESEFAVHPKTGTISTKASLDGRSRGFYVCIVRLESGGKFVSAPIEITVVDVNDHRPKFNNETYLFRLDGQFIRGQLIGRVHAVDEDFGANAAIKYSLNQSQKASSFVHLDPNTGLLYVKSFWDINKVPLLKFEVYATDGGQPPLNGSSQVVIVVEKMDGLPEFEFPLYEIAVYENASIEDALQSLHLISGKDFYKIYFLEHRYFYHILHGDPEEQFWVSRAAVLYLNKPLDREKRHVHHLTVVAHDQPTVEKSSYSVSTTVSVEVLDINDNAPIFTSPSVFVADCQSLPGTIVGQVKAVDPDKGLNGHVRYIVDPSSGGEFSLDPLRGLLKVNRALNESQSAEYNLTIWAFDHGEPSMNSSMDLRILIIGCSFNRTNMEMKQNRATISEETSPGTVVLTFGLNDSQDAAFWISPGSHQGDFVMTQTGDVLVGRRLSYERQKTYQLELNMRNGANFNEANTLSFQATIEVMDENNNAPVFLENPVRLDAVENTIPEGRSAILGYVKAVDSDFGQNARVTYSIVGGNGSVFEVDPTTGEIRLLQSLDREEKANHSLQIQATDAGFPALTSIAYVFVNVIDLNDNAPVFVEPYYYGEIVENRIAGKVLLQLVATDADEGDNGLVVYRLLDSNVPFAVDRETGILTATEPLDREQKSAWILRAVAEDCGPNSLTSESAEVRIVVLDENDNSPVFGNTRQNIYVMNSLRAGDFVYAIDASDADDGPNGRLKYSLSEEGDGHQFKINSTTGVITAVSYLSMSDSYRIGVRVTDEGQPEREAFLSLQLITRPPSEFPLFQNEEEQFLTVSENDHNAHIGSVEARSPKQAPFNRIRYSIAAGNDGGAFRVDSESGDLFSTEKLDYEFRSYYELVVAAMDSDSPQLESFTLVNIRLTDVNDNAPTFDRKVYRATILEEEPAPLPVIHVHATDKDSGLNGRIVYTLGPMESLALFDVDSQTGLITAMQSLDREKASFYRLFVTATDGGEPRLSSEAVVLVSVEDKNDSPPRFAHLFSAAVREDAPVGSYVTQVTSMDADLNSNNTYQISMDQNGLFAVDPLTGVITLSGRLDREACPIHRLSVAVLDGVWRVETSLTITVEDVNDNAPVFSKSSYSFFVSDLDPIPAVIGKVQATDNDEGPNAYVNYRLLTSSPLFSVHPLTGEISLRRALIHPSEAQGIGELTFDVIATDSGQPAMFNVTMVLVHVLPRGRKAIWFVNLAKPVPVPFNLPPSTMIHRVMFVDFRVFNGTFLGWLQSKAMPGTFSMNEEISLQIWAETDDGLRTSAVMRIIFTGQNEHKPEFSLSNYTVVLRGDLQLGSHVFKAQAYDKDAGLDGKVTYSLRCVEIEEICPFSIDPEEGNVKLIKALNRESKTSYGVELRATDGGFEPKNTTTTLTIIARDVNDGSPKFDQQKYDLILPAYQIASDDILFQFVAKDLDDESTNKVEYSIVGGDAVDLFKLDPTSGHLHMAKTPVGHSLEGTVALKVRCSNLANRLFGDIILFVHFVSDKPAERVKFSNSTYAYAVAPWSGRNQLLGYLATKMPVSNNEYFVGASAIDQPIKVDAKNGALWITGAFADPPPMIDIVAKRATCRHVIDFDTSSVRLTMIGLQGDVGPVFTHAKYSARLPENATVNSIAISLHPVRSRVRLCKFAILSGNTGGVFAMSGNGDLLVQKELDWETLSRYELLIGASLPSTEQIVDTTVVSIEVEDMNDHSPMLNEANRVGYVAENDPIGTQIMILLPYDLDSPRHQGPFFFALVNESATMFRIDSRTGILSTTALLDREQCELHKLSVAITDNGNPPKTSVEEVRIVVQDINDEPPREATLTLDVVATQLQSFAGIVVPVHPLDFDQTGRYSCKPLQVDSNVMVDDYCMLTIRRLPKMARNFALRLNGNDGKHDAVSYDVLANFEHVDKEIWRNCVTLDVSGIRSDLFRTILNPLRGAFENEGYSCHLLSVACVDEHCQVLLALRDSTRDIAPATKSLVMISELLDKLPSSGKRLDRIDVGLCPLDFCQNGGICVEEVETSSAYGHYRELDYILAFPKTSKSYHCMCRIGYAGHQCQHSVNQCFRDPCQNGGTCNDQGVCLCPNGFEGKYCEQDLDECQLGRPCKNNGYCENIPGSYRCICEQNFSGRHCEQPVDQCSTNPCLNGGTCIGRPEGHGCICKFAYSGRNCEVSSFGFNELSYMELGNLKPGRNEISLEFASIRKNALLLYSSHKAYFLAVDISDGKARLLHSTSSGERGAVAAIPKNVTNGLWHRLILRQMDAVISISVSECDSERCYVCDFQDDQCSAAIKADNSFPIDDRTLFIGGVDTPYRIASADGQLASPSFVGCLRSVKLNGLPLSARNIRSQSNLVDHCPREDEPICQESDVCQPGGQCIDRWDRRACLCKGNFVASSCRQAEKSYHFDGGFISYEVSELVKSQRHFGAFPPDAFLMWPDDQLKAHHHNLPPRWLNIEFKTHQQDGVIFFASSGASFTLIDIVNGSVRYTSRTDDLRTVQMTLIDGPLVSDGQWHMVSLASYDGDQLIEFRIDDYGKDAKIFAHLHDFFGVKLTSFFVGGTRSVLKVQGVRLSNFVGCIRRFILNGELQPWHPADLSSLLRVREARRVSQGGFCRHDDSIGCAEDSCPTATKESRFRKQLRENTGLVIALIFTVCLAFSALGTLWFFRRYNSCVLSRKKRVSIGVESRLSSLSVLANGSLSMDKAKQLDGGSDLFSDHTTLKYPMTNGPNVFGTLPVLTRNGGLSMDIMKYLSSAGDEETNSQSETCTVHSGPHYDNPLMCDFCSTFPWRLSDDQRNRQRSLSTSEELGCC